MPRASRACRRWARGTLPGTSSTEAPVNRLRRASPWTGWATSSSAGSLVGPDAVDFGCGALSEPFDARGMFVAKLDACRACTWSRGIHGASLVRVVVNASGNVVVAGNFGGGSVDLGGTVLTSSGMAGFVAELDGCCGPRASEVSARPIPRAR